ncbi:hypothetical protein CAPTEDRAFT_209633, partial [Capitella teleta]
MNEAGHFCKICVEKFKDGSGRASKVEGYSMRTSTSSLSDHLEQDHGIKIRDTLQLEKQKKIIDIFSTAVSHRTAAMDNYTFNRDMAVWFCMDIMPFSSVDGHGLNYFLSKNIPGMEIPDRSTLAKTCFDACEIIVRDDWSVAVITLSLSPLDAIGIAEHIREVFGNFIPDMSQKYLVTTHDGASTMKAVSENLKSKNMHHCMAYVLHLLLMTDSIENVPGIMGILKEESNSLEDEKAMESLLEKLEESMRIFDADEQIEDFSPQNEANAQLLESLDKSDKTQKSFRLKNEVPTRWNSVHAMLHSVKLRSKQSKRLEDSICSFGLKIALVRANVEDICEIKPEDGDEMKTLKRLVMKNVQKRLVLTEDVVVASLLDPSTKNLDILGLSSEEKIENLSNALQTHCDLLENAEEGAQVEHATTKEPLSKRQKLLKKYSSSNRSYQSKEVERFVHHQQMEEEEDPFKFWAKHATIYPNLGQLARRLLTQECS